MRSIPARAAILAAASLAILGCEPTTQVKTQQSYLTQPALGSEEYRFIKAVEASICGDRSITNDPLVNKVLKDGYLADSAIDELGAKGYEEFLYQWAIGSFKYQYPYGDWRPNRSLMQLRRNAC